MEQAPLAHDWKLDYSWWRIDEGSVVKNRLLYQLCNMMRAQSTLEIGVGRYGNGVYWFGTHAKETGNVHTAIDIHSGNLGRAQTVIDDFDLPVVLLGHDSKAVVWNKKINICYVDGGHSYEQVCGDIDNFSKWITRNGLMIFDDYGKLHLQVTEAVNDKHDPELFDMMVWPWCWWAIWKRK